MVFNNSFAALDNDSLIEKATDACISVGNMNVLANAHVNKIKSIEL
jgi:hypothetical protein